MPYSSGLVDDKTLLLVLVALPVVVPPLYGLCYGNGRALGAVLTGTRLVRLRDGGRIGPKAPRAMAVRTLLLPLLLVAVVVGGPAGGSLVRMSIDDDGTRRLRAAGFRRLPDDRAR